MAVYLMWERVEVKYLGLVTFVYLICFEAITSIFAGVVYLVQIKVGCMVLVVVRF